MRIGASDTVSNQVAPYLLSDFRKQTVQISRAFLSPNSALICEKLIDYELDIALIEGKTNHPLLLISTRLAKMKCVSFILQIHLW